MRTGRRLFPCCWADLTAERLRLIGGEVKPGQADAVSKGGRGKKGGLSPTAIVNIETGVSDPKASTLAAITRRWKPRALSLRTGISRASGCER